MSGICSAHQGHDPDCPMCTAGEHEVDNVAVKTLWQLLDHISTLGDAYKDDDATFRRRAYEIAERRNKVAHSPDGYRLVWGMPRQKDDDGAIVRAMRIAVNLIEEGLPFAAKDRLLNAIKEKKKTDGNG